MYVVHEHFIYLFGKQINYNSGTHLLGGASIKKQTPCLNSCLPCLQFIYYSCYYNKIARVSITPATSRLLDFLLGVGRKC